MSNSWEDIGGNKTVRAEVPKKQRRTTRKTAKIDGPVTGVGATSAQAVVRPKVGKPAISDVTVEVISDNVYVGFSEVTQEWYGWRNNLVAKGFKQGDRLEASGLPEGFVANNLEQARKLAVAYARKG